MISSLQLMTIAQSGKKSCYSKINH